MNKRVLVAGAFAATLGLGFAMPQIALADEPVQTADELTVADQSVGRTTGYMGEELPAAPVVTGNVWTVTPANAQYTLDGAYGDITSKTIRFAAGEYGTLELDRPTKYEGSGTQYYLRDASAGPVDWDTLVSKGPNDTAVNFYTRTVSNVTFTAEDGAVIAGFSAKSDYFYGSGHNYVLDKGISGSTQATYYSHTQLKNLVFDGLTIKNGVTFIVQPQDAYVAYGTASVDGLTFNHCIFVGDEGQMGTNTFDGIRAVVSGASFKNLSVTKCGFSDFYQAVSVQNAENVTIANNTFNNTADNAILLSTNWAGGTVSGNVVISQNIVKNAGAQAISINKSGDTTTVTANNNVFVDSGNRLGQLFQMKSPYPAKESVNLDNNYWNSSEKSKWAVSPSSYAPTTDLVVEGIFAENVIDYVAEGKDVFAITFADGSHKTLYYVGESAEHALSTIGDDDSLEVWSRTGDKITVPDGVKVTNKTSEDLIVNDVTVKPGETAVAHTHTAATPWQSDDKTHWNPCVAEDGYRMNEAEHSFTWIVDVEATATKPGSKHQQCTVCGHRLAAVEIPATGEEEPKPSEWTVTLKSNAPGAKDSVVKVSDGSKLAEPVAPEYEGYTFLAWYTDAALTNKYDFASPVTGDLTLYGGWSKNAEQKPSEEETQKPAGDKGDAEKPELKPEVPSTGDAGSIAAVACAAAGTLVLTVASFTRQIRKR